MGVPTSLYSLGGDATEERQELCKPGPAEGKGRGAGDLPGPYRSPLIVSPSTPTTQPSLHGSRRRKVSLEAVVSNPAIVNDLSV